jgi:hypothetical protein
VIPFEHREVSGHGNALAPYDTLDLRGLPAPEPLVRALNAADALPPGAALELFTPMLPMPLIDALSGRGLRVTAQQLPDGSARVLVQCMQAPACGGHGEDPH